MRDTDNNEVFKENPHDQCIGALAWTHISSVRERPSQITICNWFFRFVQENGVPSCKAIDSRLGAWAFKVLDKMKIPTALMGYTQFDYFQLPDRVMLHEVKVKSFSNHDGTDMVPWHSLPIHDQLEGRSMC